LAFVDIEPTAAEIAAGLELELEHPELFGTTACPRCGSELSRGGRCEHALDD
jgi:hypothetical protein